MSRSTKVYVLAVLAASLANAGVYAVLSSKRCARQGGVTAIGVFRLHCVAPVGGTTATGHRT